MYYGVVLKGPGGNERMVGIWKTWAEADAEKNPLAGPRTSVTIEPWSERDALPMLRDFGYGRFPYAR